MYGSKHVIKSGSYFFLLVSSIFFILELKCKKPQLLVIMKVKE